MRGEYFDAKWWSWRNNHEVRFRRFISYYCADNDAKGESRPEDAAHRQREGVDSSPLGSMMGREP